MAQTLYYNGTILTMGGQVPPGGSRADRRRKNPGDRNMGKGKGKSRG